MSRQDRKQIIKKTIILHLVPLIQFSFAELITKHEAIEFWYTGNSGIDAFNANKNCL